MSIKEFHSAYPVDERFMKDISSSPDYGTMSPVRYLSGFYIREGMNGLSTTASRLARRVEAGTAKADKEDHEALLVNAGAVFLGHTVVAIEDMVLSGYFDQIQLNRKLEYAFTGSTFNLKPIPNPYEEKLADIDIDLLTRTALADKTFTSFFKHKYSILPKSLRILLAESGTYQQINDILLPEYYERVKKLVEANEERIQLAKLDSSH